MISAVSAQTDMIRKRSGRDQEDMKRSLRITAVLMLAFMLLASGLFQIRSYAEAKIQDGSYRVDVSLAGGSGRASVATPAALLADRETAGTELRFFFALLGISVLAAVSPAHKCDSNGRILTSARYENSVYQLFRPEVAGG